MFFWLHRLLLWWFLIQVLIRNGCIIWCNYVERTEREFIFNTVITEGIGRRTIPCTYIYIYIYIYFFIKSNQKSRKNPQPPEDSTSLRSFVRLKVYTGSRETYEPSTFLVSGAGCTAVSLKRPRTTGSSDTRCAEFALWQQWLELNGDQKRLARRVQSNL